MSSRVKGRQVALPIVHEHAAGIDIGSRFHVVAVPPDACDEPVQSFQAFTADLERMADWLVRVGVTTVAMESTGVYWVPVFEILEDRGIEVILANARDAKAVPGRKTDVNDAQWLQRLHSYGLLRASFRPGREIAALRSYLRLRERHLDYGAAHIQHMQKALTFMNLQLHHVVSDITGVTGMRIVRAIVAGERNADVLAAMRDVRCKSTIRPSGRR
jgi:transposase